MVDINCLVCKKPMEIPSCTKLEDYDGQLFCCECNLLWDVKFKSSELKKYKLAKQQLKVKPATMNIIVANEKTKQLTERVAERLLKP